MLQSQPPTSHTQDSCTNGFIHPYLRHLIQPIMAFHKPWKLKHICRGVNIWYSKQTPQIYCNTINEKLQLCQEATSFFFFSNPLIPNKQPLKPLVSASGHKLWQGEGGRGLQLLPPSKYDREKPGGATWAKNKWSSDKKNSNASEPSLENVLPPAP